MPTYNRRRFLPQALRCFSKRTYRRAELIVIDDSERSVASLCRQVEGVRYLRVPVSTIGTKLNLGIEAARGDILQRMDDDDYYGPSFLRSSVRHLRGKDPDRTLVTRCCFLTLIRSDGILRQSGHGWTPGGAFCFFRSLWRRTPFRDLNCSEDSQFLRDSQPDVVRICETGPYILIRHGSNTWNAVIVKNSAVLTDTDVYLRSRPASEKLPSQVFDQEALAFYRRLLGWRNKP